MLYGHTIGSKLGVRPLDQLRQTVVYVEPSVYIDGKKLKVVDKFTYLGSTINRFCSLGNEIALRLEKAAGAFSALKDRVWLQRGLKKTTKLEVYNACVLTCLLYACETLVVYRRHLKHPEQKKQTPFSPAGDQVLRRKKTSVTSGPLLEFLNFQI